MVISSLGITAMTAEHRTRIVRPAEPCLAPAGIMMEFQYVTSLTPSGSTQPATPAIPGRRILETVLPKCQRKACIP